MEQQTFTRAEAEQDVHIMAERLAMLYHFFVQAAEQRYGREEARELARDAIAAYGQECGRLTRENVVRQGFVNDLAHHHLGGDLPKTGWRQEVLETTESTELVKVSYCPLAETWKRYGAEEWGRIYCEVDPAKFSGYNECFTCTTLKNVLDGAEYCLIRVEYK